LGEGRGEVAPPQAAVFVWETHAEWRNMTAQDHPLAGVWAKISRAEKHIAELTSARKTFLNSRPYVFTGDQNPNSGHIDITVLDVKPTPLEILVIIGDVIHNLRSPLDLLACQLVKRQRPSGNCKDIYFPIANSSERFMTVIDRPEIKHMGAEAVNQFQRLEPYRGGNGEAIWQIHELSIKDKHRFLIVVGAGLQRLLAASLDTSIFPRATIVPFDFSASVASDEVVIFEKGSKILSVDPSVLTPNPGDQRYVKLQAIGDITFDEPPVIDKKPVLDTLQGFVNVVRATVEQFAQLFPSSPARR